MQSISAGLALVPLALSLCASPIEIPHATPEQMGMSTSALDNWRFRLSALKTNALLVLRDDRIVYEWYADGHGPDRKEGTASLAKAIVGGSALLVAMQDKRVKPDDYASKYIPRWASDPTKSRITIRELATHTSGIEDAEQNGIAHMQIPGWKGDFWRRSPDPFSIAVEKSPVIFEPGTSYAYSNPGMAALAYAVTASLRGTAHPDLLSLLQERVLRPLNVPDSEWSIGYNHPYNVDGLKLYANWGGGAFTPRATARIGQLMLHGGEWNGKRLFDRMLVQTMTAYAGMPVQKRTSASPGPASGLCWWINSDGVWPEIPRDAFVGAGAGQELLLVVPSLNLVVVRNGAALGAPDHFWKDAVEQVFNPVVEIAKSRSPYPESPVIAAVEFGPEKDIVRRAIDSDNWPITWGDDDLQYTSYGDGEGFEPFVDHKLSLGFAKIAGPPDAFTGTNIRSPTGERTGNGPKGLKSSGMLMVDRILYMFVRNAGNAQLAWSEDRGANWQWGFHFSTSFGSPSFLNFGKDYAGARDEYVYIYSQDGANAYEPSDSLVLARVQKNRIRDPRAYEFYGGADHIGHPAWTRDISLRRAIFDFPGHCQRVDAVYNPFLKRYLLAVGYNHLGGWGLYDSPEPWGPWTTAFHTDHWGLGGTHGYRLPSKWIGPDPQRMTLVFSGVKLPNITYDAFCVRSMKFTLRETEKPK